jgi:hypothetical protein
MVGVAEFMVRVGRSSVSNGRGLAYVGVMLYTQCERRSDCQ